MCGTASAAREEFINRVFTSRIPGQAPKRFAFADGEVGALYTIGRDRVTGKVAPVLLVIATFPPSPQQGGLHDFGIDYLEQPVASAEEAAQLLAQFDREQAALFRHSCRPAAAGA